MGASVGEGDNSSVVVEGGELEIVGDFTYLGSTLSSDGEITAGVSCRISKASKAFGCLRVPVFLNHTVSINIKRAVYKAVVIYNLLYGAETWTLKAPDVRRLTAFHNRCVRTILDVSRFQNHITTQQLSGQFGPYWSIAEF